MRLAIHADLALDHNAGRIAATNDNRPLRLPTLTYIYRLIRAGRQNNHVARLRSRDNMRRVGRRCLNEPRIRRHRWNRPGFCRNYARRVATIRVAQGELYLVARIRTQPEETPGMTMRPRKPLIAPSRHMHQIEPRSPGRRPLYPKAYANPPVAIRIPIERPIDRNMLKRRMRRRHFPRDRRVLGPDKRRKTDDQ